MSTRKPFAAAAAALALVTCNHDGASGQPRPPGPPPMMAMPRPPVMGPVAGPPRVGGLGVPGGIGPGTVGGPPRSTYVGMPVGPGPGAIGGPFHPGSMPPVPPGGRPPGPVLGPVGGPPRPGGIGPGGVPTYSPGLGGLGAVARAGAAAGHPPTYAVSRQALANQATQVRDHFGRYRFDCFHPDWWRRHDAAWRAAGWAAAYYYRPSGWSAFYDYCGYSGDPVYYDYGSNVVYSGGSVYSNGDAVGTEEQYARQAAIIADAGKQARAADDGWLPLGVFAVVPGGQATGNDLFQLAVNRAGVIRGNYYNVLADTNLPVSGSVDRTTKRAAWTVGDRKEPVYEAGLANLSRSETTMLVHFGKDRTQQWTLVRIEQPEESK